MITVFLGSEVPDQTVQVGIAICDRCGRESVCLTMDGSEGEYASPFICQECILPWLQDYDSLYNQDVLDEAEACEVALELAKRDVEHHGGERYGGYRFSTPPEGKNPGWYEHFIRAYSRAWHDLKAGRI